MYENETYEVILERMLNRVSDKLDKRPSSPIYDTHSPTAIEFQILYIELEYLIKNSYGDTAAREFLVLLAKDRGLTPEPATKAVLKGEFTPATIDVTGKRFNIGDINYAVIEQITPGQYQVQCETEGTVGNQYLGDMIPMEYIEGLQTAQLTEILIPGEDEEDTEVFRQRYFDSFNEQSFGGNRAAYIETVKKIDGVGNLKVTRVWNGDIRPADMIPSTKVTSWYNSVISGLDAEVATWLSAVYMASFEKKLTVGGTVLITVVNSLDFGEASTVLLNKIQEELDPVENAGEGYGLAPIGHVVSVKSAEPVQSYITTTVTFDEGYNWSNTKTEIEEAVGAYLLELRKAWADNTSTIVRVSQIETRILSVKGVLDVANTKINGSTSNLTLTKYQIPVLGGCFCMIRDVDLVSYLPPFMQTYKEPVAALEAENPEFQIIWKATDRVLYNRFISTADEYGISRFEKMLGIHPTSEDTLESRRSRVQSKWFNKIPYTMRVLLQKLTVLCGNTDFSLTHDFKVGYTLTLETDLELYGQVEELEYIINSMIPENIVVVSKNSIPCNVKGAVLFGGGVCFVNHFTITNDFREVFDIGGKAAFGGGIVQTEMLNITNDSRETVAVQGVANFGGSVTDTAMVTISQDFSEVFRADGDANIASGVVHVDFIEIKTT